LFETVSVKTVRERLRRALDKDKKGVKGAVSSKVKPHLKEIS
jgi:hypothetical protein